MQCWIGHTRLTHYFLTRKVAQMLKLVIISLGKFKHNYIVLVVSFVGSNRMPVSGVGLSRLGTLCLCNDQNSGPKEQVSDSRWPLIIHWPANAMPCRALMCGSDAIGARLLLLHFVSVTSFLPDSLQSLQYLYRGNSRKLGHLSHGTQ